MGAIHRAMDPVLLRRLTDLLPLETFVGSVDTSAQLRSVLTLFGSAHLIEPYPELGNTRTATVHTGDGPDALRALAPELTGGVFFWLDPETHRVTNAPRRGGGAECQVLAELEAIGALGPDSVVVIDDARLFLAPPPPPHDPAHWPDLNEVLAGLQALSDAHELMVVDDVIVFYPIRVRAELRQHARQVAIDWLGELRRAHDQSAELSLLRQALDRGSAQAADMQRQLESIATTVGATADGVPGRHVNELLSRVGSLERMHSRRLFGIAARWRAAKTRANRLATLRHHPPKPLHVPDRYRVNGRLPDPPTISIVTPSLNHAGFLPQTIESVLAQDYPALEYVVQDGDSDDGTKEILEGFSARLHHWASERDSGQTEALNRGFTHTSGEIMAYLNSDDMLLPGTLDYVARYLRENPDVDVVYGHRVLVDENGDEIGRWVLPRHDDEILSWADFVPQETLFWRRSAWEAAGGSFDESFRFAMDWDVLVRLRGVGARMVRLPRFLGAFRVHDDQKTSAQGPTLGLSEMNRIRKRLHGREVSHDEVLRNIRPYLVRHVMLDQLYRRRLLRY